jgi:hypothetical protein
MNTDFNKRIMKEFKLQRMMTMVLLFIITVLGVKVNAQVLIGSNKSTEKAAILEIKTKEPVTTITNVTDDGNVTIDPTKGGGGVGLPRVKLVDRETLQPFVKTDDPDWIAASTSKIKEHHAGLTVYNLTDDAAKNLHQGTYIWNGAKWALIGGKRFFYMPSFNIAITGNGVYTRNLYTEYKKQFDKSAADSQFISSNSELTEISSLENGKIYEKDELDYVVTYYDSTVMDPPTLGTGANAGELTFKVTNATAFSNNTYFTIVLVVK